MQKIDINSDLGELSLDRDKQIMPYITSCSIACGGHIGTKESVNATIAIAKENGVKVGAHPSYPDKDNFGRKSLSISKQSLKDSIEEQVTLILEEAGKLDMKITHWKAHGALYNDLMKDQEMAALFLELMDDLSFKGSVFGMTASALEREASRRGIAFVKEGFLDRRYLKVNRLLARSEEGAVYQNIDDCINQFYQISKGQIDTVENGQVPISLNTLCLHGDSPIAIDLAEAIHHICQKEKIGLHAY